MAPGPVLREQVPVDDGGRDAQQQRRQPRAPRAATNEQHTEKHKHTNVTVV